MAGRVDDQRPDQRAHGHEREVLEPVDQGMPERRVVQDGEMPCDEDAEPQRHRDARPEEEREAAAQRLPACQRREQVAGKEEHRERPAHGDERERDSEVGDQHVLEHVRRLQVLLGDRVERRDDPEHDERDAREEQRPARPRRQLGPPAAQPPPALREERDCHDRAREHERVERPRLPEVVRRGRNERDHGSATVALPGAARSAVGYPRRTRMSASSAGRERKGE